MIFLFWFLVALLFYVYFGYPLILCIISIFYPRDIKKDDIVPYVSIITAAFNEEKVIEETIRNKAALHYPKDKMEYIIVSDCSSDGTDGIVERLREELRENGLNISFLRQDKRNGKTMALNKAVEFIKSREIQYDDHIIVFADANSIYAEDALLKLARNFADESVGYVTGKMIYVNEDGNIIGEGCSLYMQYENKLRFWETKINSVVGVDGGVDAVRLKLYEYMDKSDLPDFVLPLSVVAQGYRVVYEEEAVLKEHALNKPKNEFKMRVRVALRSYKTLIKMKRLLNPLKYHFYSWQLLSHKILRYSCGLLQVLLFIVNVMLIGKAWYYRPFLALQELFYIFAFCGFFYSDSDKNRKYFYIPYYFCLLNYASLYAIYELLQNKDYTVWNPRKGD